MVALPIPIQPLNVPDGPPLVKELTRFPSILPGCPVLQLAKRCLNQSMASSDGIVSPPA